MYEDTIIIYTSDQGMLLGEHDYSDKRWIFEESMQMPFLMRVPGEVTGGRKIEELVSNLDFAPTLLDFAGIPVPESMEGRSFRPLLTGSCPADWQKEIYYRYWLHMTHCDTPAHYGLRTKEYKMVYYYGLPLDANGALPDPTPQGWELYDLVKDPFEMHNVYENPAYADVVKDLKERLFARKAAIGDDDTQYPELYSAAHRA